MILPDYLDNGLHAVFCGTAAGNRSAAVKHYYAGRGNKFWRMLFEIGLTTERLMPDQDSRIVEHGLGLTDLVKHHSGNDDTLRREMYDVAGFEQKILRHAPRFVAFNGKEAPSIYLGIPKRTLRPGLQERRIGQTQLFVLPSTSGSANGSWDEAPWHEFVALIVKR